MTRRRVRIDSGESSSTECPEPSSRRSTIIPLTDPQNDGYIWDPMEPMYRLLNDDVVGASYVMPDMTKPMTRGAMADGEREENSETEV